MRRLAAAVCTTALLVSCTSGGAPVAAPKPVRDEPYLLPPTAGYPLTVAAEIEARVDALFQRLRAGEDVVVLEAEVRALDDEASAVGPVSVLLAQVLYLKRHDRMVLDLLQPIADELPEYLACQVLKGYAAERLGKILIAYEAFQRVSASDLARGRAEELRGRALEIALNRLDGALLRGQLEIAEEQRDWLEKWVGEERITLEAGRRIRVAEGDLEGELEVVRRLVELEPGRELEQRRGVLEIEVGEVRAGLGVFEKLAAELPEDDEIRRQLDRAKFRWRLELLPPMVRELGRKGQLERADLAVVLYWLVPQVRTRQVTNPPIATDILDHPQRDAILKVVNLGLMRVDEVLHKFDPDAPVTRLDTLAALLRLLGFADRSFACLDGADVGRLAAATWWVCGKAASCRLIPEAADCLPRAPISGGEVLDLLRSTLSLLGSGETRADS